MATYDFAWVTNHRYDSLTAGASGIVPRLRAYAQTVASKWSAAIVGNIRVGDYVHCRVMLDDNISPKAFLDDLKGQLSFILQDEYPDDLKPIHHGKYMWKRNDYFMATDNPGDSAVDAWVAKRPKHSLP